MKSPFQTSESAFCSSVLAGSGTLRSGHSAETPTAQPWCSRGGAFMQGKTANIIWFALTPNKTCTVGCGQNILMQK